MTVFTLSVVSGVVASVLVLLAQTSWAIGVERARLRHLRWLWCVGRRISPRGSNLGSAAITFSLIETFDAIPGRRTIVAVSHIGDAQAAALAQKTLAVDLKRGAELLPGGGLVDDRKHVICIGGPTFNATTRRVLSLYEELLPIYFSKSDRGEYQLIEAARPHITYHQEISDRRTIEDWGIIIALPHPERLSASDDTSLCLVLAGLSTFGTLAAAKFATNNESLGKLRRSLDTARTRYFCALLRTWPADSYLDVRDIQLYNQWLIEDPRGNAK